MAHRFVADVIGDGAMPVLSAAQSNPNCNELARRLAGARRLAQQVQELPLELLPSTHDMGYAVNRMVVEQLGWETLGWKIAGTTASVREKLKIDHPIYGRTFKQFAMRSPLTLRFDDLLDPLIECEFFVTLARDLPWRSKPWTEAEVFASIGDVHAGIEIAECRFPAANLPPLPAIFADGCASGRYIYGGPIRNWRDGLADLQVHLEVDDKKRRSGVGADVMGNPLAPLLWLAEELRRWGQGLQAGEMISTGSATGMFPVRIGQKVRATFGSTAKVEIEFSG